MNIFVSSRKLAHNFKHSMSSSSVNPRNPHRNLEDKSKNFHSRYALGETLGSGAFSTVKKCTRTNDGKEFACKIVRKSHMSETDKKNLEKEIKILNTIRKSKRASKYTIHMEDFIETSKHIYIILELCKGKDLFSYLLSCLSKDQKQYNLDEQTIALIFYQLVKAVRDCHKLGVVHRDLKPENVLFTDENSYNIKLTDFGLSSFGQSIMKTKCGTPKYVAPEVITNNFYTKDADYWSLGILFYVMLSGRFPYNNKNHKLLYIDIINNPPNFKNKVWLSRSKPSMDLVERLLNKDPKKRPNYSQILKHPFLKMHLPTSNTLN